MTLAAWNWPARFISFEMGRLFNFNNPIENAESIKKINLHHINPKSHADILESIVDTSSDFVRKKIENCLACSLRADGSIDRTHIDKIYILAKIVNEKGVLETLFIGVAEQTERGAEGLLNAIKRGVNSHDANLYDNLLQKISSLVTDGASVNRYGLWQLIDRDVKSVNSPLTVLKIWCVAHRSELAWSDVSKSENEVAKLFQNLTRISSFLHVSAMRMTELKKVSHENNVTLLHLPKLYEVRWSEFTYALLNAVLRSWQCLVIYFQSSNEPESKGHLRFLTKHKNLQLTAFLADLLFILQRFQKKIQSDNLHIISLADYMSNLATTFENPHAETLIAVWESVLKESVQTENNQHNEIAVSLKGIQLSSDEFERRGAHNRKRDFKTVRRDIINAVTDSFTKRFAVDKDLLNLAIPFVNFDKDTVNLREFHKFFCPDLDLCSLQFDELNQSKDFKDLNLVQKVFRLANNDETSSYKEILIALARIMAATPHSADCERSISANNLLKTSMRSSLSLETENRYLHVHFNMPTLEEWDPRETVTNWISQKQRRHHELLIEGENKSKQQPYFKGVFTQAKLQEDTDTEGCDNSNSKETQVTTRKF